MRRVQRLTKSHDEKSSISWPRMLGVRRHDQTRNLNAYRNTEEEGSMLVEPIRKGSDQEDGDEVHLRMVT